MGKSRRLKSSDHAGTNAPLATQIIDDKSARPSGRVKPKKSREREDTFVDDKLSKKILEQARKQQEELEDEHGIQRKPIKKRGKVCLDSGDRDPDSEDEEDLLVDDAHYEQVQVDEEDEEALHLFMNEDPPQQRTLADIIQEKLTEKKTEIQSQMSDNASLMVQDLDDRVINMYKNVKQILTKYRSGKLPKAFKIVPSLRNWEQILYILEPDSWSAAAMYQASRTFVSNLNAKMAQRFFNLVLLPRIRDDISEYKQLNFHLYMSLRKALFKPAAFFKGILLPLCESGTCTLREAVIVSSILAKSSIPMLHSAAAILKIAEMDYNGASSIFLRTLLDKKYALPYRVVDAVVFHFLKFNTDKRDLPVLWHQCLLTFAQRYKQDISSEQKSSLLDLLRVHCHSQITPEVRREISNSKCRDGEVGMAE